MIVLLRRSVLHIDGDYTSSGWVGLLRRSALRQSKHLIRTFDRMRKEKDHFTNIGHRIHSLNRHFFYRIGKSPETQTGTENLKSATRTFSLSTVCQNTEPGGFAYIPFGEISSSGFHSELAFRIVQMLQQIRFRK